MATVRRKPPRHPIQLAKLIGDIATGQAKKAGQQPRPLRGGPQPDGSFVIDDGHQERIEARFRKVAAQAGRTRAEKLKPRR